MARQTKKFTFITPFTVAKSSIDIEISGIGYCYPNNEPQDMYDYDIECVKVNNQEFTEAYKLLAHDQDSRLVDTIHDATMAHMGYLFSSDYAECEMCEREPDPDLDRHLDIPTEEQIPEIISPSKAA